MFPFCKTLHYGEVFWSNFCKSPAPGDYIHLKLLKHPERGNWLDCTQSHIVSLTLPDTVKLQGHASLSLLSTIKAFKIKPEILLILRATVSIDTTDCG